MCCIKEYKIPEGTKMVFYQKDVPKGWKLLNINNNKSIICVKIKEEE